MYKGLEDIEINLENVIKNTFKLYFALSKI